MTLFYVVYKITNQLNGKYYIGAHATDDLDDGYMGSGIAIARAIEKHGVENFTFEIISHASCEAEMYQMEKEIIGDLWTTDRKCYNMTAGGVGGFAHIDNTGDNNPMRRPDVVKKVSEKLSEIRKDEKYRAMAIQNLKKANNKGRKRPQFSILISKVLKEHYREFLKNPENRIVLSKRLARHKYKVSGPYGEVTYTYRLDDIIEKHGGSVVSLYRTMISGKPVSKGCLKGFFVEAIEKD